MESSLKTQIQRYLVESGNYEKISNNLNEKLLQDGWMDEVRRMTMDEISSNKSTNYADILAKIEPQALSM
ncbi:similar to Saccharomyces cerevisiae YBR111W-A SUS1 Component of both the SAGA histone acetylase and TREX-2 complexes [Maudiozyma barnettii]|uniref:Similar to Saccharomyces cerevisiae YBR111W-A SUS1 Component of both the SAGA histone acetylase and TREX-2 complexes n=1 Tax=Maudiozyma barnettii TaxID=61262 RepID=A0A8H2VAY4_9SACH|nr:Sus1p [Kazachstania barnettii]CAB4251928.1 similar to Saccharomyces cerevisiae YBR111W-A SUS1 Component of both the SAGA histone acetylase and TREX-2 complexes [Kazachstania barnettii]CAD1778277.1 similar to Saccharomyces cerevisiae YBR111W-A SUS1 Component of both the SAGA histone acetylase and TREX-2 complexes [Kazachstania barnettii]